MRFFLMLILTINLYSQTARFVSKTGNSTPPYTSWETAHDSIRPVIDICNPGDTIFIDSGIYDDTLDINIPLTFIGKGIDETTINGIDDRKVTVNVNANCSFEGINFIGSKKLQAWSSRIILLTTRDTLFVNNCKFKTGKRLVANYYGSSIIKSSFFESSAATAAVSSIAPHSNDRIDLIENCVFWGTETGSRAINLNNGNFICSNNHFFGDLSKNISGYGQKVLLQNNFFSAILGPVEFYLITDSIEIRNNIFQNNLKPGGYGLSLVDIKSAQVYNNIFINNYYAVVVDSFNEYLTDYNCYYSNLTDLDLNAKYGPNDILMNPMLEKEFTNFTSPEELEAKLQKNSPLINAGKPDILDVNGTRSDIGLYGGPAGMSYEYKDLIPLIPKGFDGEKLNNSFRLFWDANDEYDLKNYKLYSYSDSNCVIQTGVTNIAKTETSYQADIPQETRYFKLTAVDSADNEGGLSNRVIVYDNGIVDVTEVITPYQYKLYQNYPNPFNPETNIQFSLKEESHVIIKVYDIKGELVKRLYNGQLAKGNHTVNFIVNDLPSGIYIVNLRAEKEGKLKYSNSMKVSLIK